MKDINSKLEYIRKCKIKDIDIDIKLKTEIIIKIINIIPKKYYDLNYYNRFFYKKYTYNFINEDFRIEHYKYKNKNKIIIKGYYIASINFNSYKYSYYDIEIKDFDLKRFIEFIYNKIKKDEILNKDRIKINKNLIKISKILGV